MRSPASSTSSRSRRARRPARPSSLSGGFFDRDAGSTAGKGVGTLFGANATIAAGAERRLVVPRLGRLLQLRSAAAADRPDSADSGSARSDGDGRRRHLSGGRDRRARHGVRERGHQPAEVRRARRSGDRRRAHHVSGRRRRHRAASSTPASDRSTSSTGSYMGYAKVNYRKARCKVNFFTQPRSTPRRRTCCCRTRSRGSRCS